MSSSKSTNPGAELINITELLEKILLHLSERDLLRLQRVSQIKSVTEGSALLQRKLFLAPEPPSDLSPRPIPLLFGGDEPFIYKLGLSPSNAYPGTAGVVAQSLAGVRIAQSHSLGQLPILESAEVREVGGIPQAVVTSAWARALSYPWLLRRQNIASLNAGVGMSARKMMLFQPPVKILWHLDTGYRLTHQKGELAAASTLQDLVEQMIAGKK